MAEFAVAHCFTAQWESGLINHPADPGGITNYGVSLRWLRSLGHDLGDIDGDGDIDADDVRALTREQAAALFKARFWDDYGLGYLPPATATCQYDCAVNTGPRQATLLTQQACNALVGNYGVKLAVDGVFGPATRTFLTLHATPALLNAMLEQRARFYERLAAQRPPLAVFLRGWLRRCTGLRRYLGLGA